MAASVLRLMSSDAVRTAGAVSKREADPRRREKAQTDYVEDFTAAVRDYLGFDARHVELAGRLAAAVAAHATPVGSGTVARTKRIPVEQRAEAAVIAWLRHQTTAYDDMHVARVKGARRELRRTLAAGSKALLDRYEVQEAGGREHLEYWIPAEDLPAFNAAIVGEIEVIAEYPEPGALGAGDHTGSR